MPMSHPELPDELQGSAQPRPESGDDRLAAIGQIVAKKRDEAVKARKESGIEQVWSDCEDAYLGIDDANRGEFAKARWAKPTSMSGPVTTNGTNQTENKSTAYVRLTTRYVDMGAAKICEIVLPIDDKAFSFSATPVPELIQWRDDPGQVIGADGQPVWRDATSSDMASLIQANPAAAFMQAQGGEKPQVPLLKKDVAAAKLREANAKAQKAETRVYDWMVESRYPMQMRKVIHDSSRIGVGVLKGPFPEQRTSKAFRVKDGVGVLEIVTRISPACKWIDPWNFFPSGNCGEDVHCGDAVFERDFLSPASLKALKKMKGPDGLPIYLPGQIDKVLAEGPEKCNTEGYQGKNPNQPDTKDNRFAVWHMTGTLSREDMLVLQAPGAEELPDEVVECFCIVTLVNDTVIRATMNPLTKSGHFPYRVFPWSRRAGHWAGVGVGEQVSMPQRMVNAGTRAWMNNAGISAGVQIFFDQHKVIPLDGNWDITPNKLWGLTVDGATDDVRKIMSTIEIPNRGRELLEIINYAFKLSEEQSNIPLISQGQTGPQDPQTFGQAELQNNNANTLLRQQAYSLDDHITEPLVDDFYEWLLLDPDVPEDEKGDFKINARGSIAMVEKAIQENTLVQMLSLALNPVFGQDPKKVYKELLKAKRMDPERTAYTEEELAAMQQQPPPKHPSVEAAEIRAKTALHVEDMRGQTVLKRAAIDTDRDTAYNNSLAERDRIAAQSAEAKRLQDYQLALAKYANDRQINLEDAKTELAKAAMQLQTQIRLAVGGGKAPQVATPAIEPAGRAPEGEAFQR